MTLYLVVFNILFLFKNVYKTWINKGGDSRGKAIMYLKYVTSGSFNAMKLRHTQKLMTCSVAESRYGQKKTLRATSLLTKRRFRPGVVGAQYLYQGV